MPFRIDTIWLKTTLLSAVQHAAAVMLTGFGGDSVNFWHIAWHDVLGLAGGTALASVLAAVVAYKAPTPGQAAVVSVPTGAAQAAKMALSAEPTYFTHDERGARS